MSKRYRRGFSGLIILVVGSHLLSLGLLVSSLFLSRAWDVKRLESVLPLLEQLELRDYRNQGWCKNIFYKEGAFSNNNEQSTCNLFAETARPFTPDAEHTFRRLARTLRARQLNVRWISRFSDEQKALTTEFHLGCFFCSRPRYVYEPGYEVPLTNPTRCGTRPLTKIGMWSKKTGERDADETLKLLNWRHEPFTGAGRRRHHSSPVNASQRYRTCPAPGRVSASRQGSGVPVFGCAVGGPLPSSQPQTPCPP